MKHLNNIAGILLGLLFMIFGTNFFLNFISMPNNQAAADAPHKLFMAAMIPTGYLAFVKILEILGGMLVAIPRLRNLGLLILGPIIINILCFHIFLRKGETLADPINGIIAALALLLLWLERKPFLSLVWKVQAGRHQSTAR